MLGAASALARVLCNASNSFCHWQRTAASSFLGAVPEKLLFHPLGQFRFPARLRKCDAVPHRPCLDLRHDGRAGLVLVRKRHACGSLPSIELVDQDLGGKDVFDFCTCNAACKRPNFQY